MKNLATAIFILVGAYALYKIASRFFPKSGGGGGGLADSLVSNLFPSFYTGSHNNPDAPDPDVFVTNIDGSPVTFGQADAALGGVLIGNQPGSDPNNPLNLPIVGNWTGQ